MVILVTTHCIVLQMWEVKDVEGRCSAVTEDNAGTWGK
uniref:Uncharacterized protein n=1 Tax=Setaria italica TaxID=4555 RepID=K3YP36_SETIT